MTDNSRRYGPAQVSIWIDQSHGDHECRAHPLEAVATEPPRARTLSFGVVDISLALAAAAAASAAFGPIVFRLASLPSDFRAHAYFAELFVTTGVLLSPACLIHLLLAAIVRLGLAASFLSAIRIVVVASYAAGASALYLVARNAFRHSSSGFNRALSFTIAIGVPFVQPAVPWGDKYSIGYL
jgi:hypothetical protein